MIASQPPREPRWAAQAATAHLFTGHLSACKAVRWGDSWRALKRPHYLDECRTCLAASTREPSAKSLRIDSSRACRCGQTIRVTWYELDDGHGTLVPRCRSCARSKRHRAWRAKQ